MRIVHVVETLDVGGLERVVVGLSAEQVRRGDAVTIVCLFHDGPLARDARAAGVDVVACGKRSGFDLRALRRLSSAIRRATPNVLHTHNPAAHYYGVLASLGLSGLRRISTRHGMGTFRASARRERFYRWSMRATHLAVAVCDAARERFVSLGVLTRAGSTVIANGIDLGRFEPRDDKRRAELVRALDLGETDVVLGSVGRLNEAKDPLNLVDAFALLLADRPTAALVIVGDGELRGVVEDRIRAHGIDGRVRLLGTRADVPSLLASFDAFVLASTTEGYSLALVEAAAASLPSVATDVGGNQEIVQHGVTGLIVPPGDSRALAEGMRRLASASGPRVALGHAARLWALEHGSVVTMADAYAAVYRVASPDGRRDDRGATDAAGAGSTGAAS